MKDTEDVGFRSKEQSILEGYLEKPRKYRDRTKKRRLTAEEIKELQDRDIHPKHQPYKRKKNWVSQVDEE